MIISDIHEAASILRRHWNELTRIDELPAACRPADRAAGYAIQAEFGRLSGQAVAGWKIAAASRAGQVHIGVDGPLAGRLLADRMLDAGARVPPVAILPGDRVTADFGALGSLEVKFI
jgi:2-keto-4-pentenoate hydratase